MPEEIEVPTEHLHEKMEEEAEHGGRWVMRVAVSSAILAVAAAISALYAGGFANQAILEEMQATDKWAYFQAKGIKANVGQSKIDTLAALGKPITKEDAAQIEQYKQEQGAIEKEAHALEEDSEAHMQQHEQIARAVTLFQIAIAMGAISVLAKKQQLWFISLGLGAAGLYFMGVGLL